MPQKESLKGIIKRKKKSITHDDRQGGKNYLFIIAINDYPNYNKLYNAVEDAKAIEQVLEERYVFEEILTLHDVEASRNNILEYLELLENQITSKDNLCIFFSGHGYAQKKVGFIVPHDAPANSRRGFIENSTLMNHLRISEAHHILLVLDSCFSGSLLVGKDVQTKVVAERVDKIPSRYGIAAGNIELVSDGVAGNHSPFAKAIIEFLKKNQIDKLPVSQLFQEVRKRTATNAKQTPLGGPIPVLDNDGGEFVFELKAKGEADVWKKWEAVGTIAAMKSYLKKYPTGKYVETAYWTIATIKNTELSYDSYIEHFPNGKHIEVAEQKMAEIEEDNYWKRTKNRDSLAAYRGYNRQYKNGKYKTEANQRLKELRAEAEKEATIIVPKQEIITAPVKKIEAVPHIIKLPTDPNTFTDPRDGQLYKTVKLKDGNIWLAQNLNFDVGEGCWFYDNDPKNGEKYGRLYTWDAAKKACPEGWRMPSDEEVKKLIDEYGGVKTAYKSLIKGGDSGFSALLGGGRRSGGDFGSLGDYGTYWSSSEQSSSLAWSYSFNSYRKSLCRDNHVGKTLGFSCRCLQDSSAVGG